MTFYLQRANAQKSATEPRVSPGGPWHRGSCPPQKAFCSNPNSSSCRTSSSSTNAPQQLRWQRGEFQDPVDFLPCESCSQVPRLWRCGRAGASQTMLPCLSTCRLAMLVRRGLWSHQCRMNSPLQLPAGVYPLLRFKTRMLINVRLDFGLVL